VSNCLSPYVPSESKRIDRFLKILSSSRHAGKDGQKNLLLDIGCGDGRVCIAAAKVTGCKSVGIDVSPPCIAMARAIAEEEGLDEDQCVFYELDATIDPSVLLSDSSPISQVLKSVTIVFLYTYPTLLTRLVPLLSALGRYNLRAVITLTYHLPEHQVVLEEVDQEHELQIYSRVLLTDRMEDEV